MCRQHQLWGCMLAAFGVGILLGLWLEGGFFCHCFGFGAIFLGFGMFRRK